MKKRMFFSVLISAILLGLMAGNANAGFIGQIWTGTGYNQTLHDLTNAKFATFGTAAASFTVDMIDFTTEPYGSATYNQFLSNAGQNNLVWADAASAAFGLNTMTTDSTNTSFFQIIGSTYLPASFTIRHDDGFDLYIDGKLFDFSTPTIPTDAFINLSAQGLSAGVHNFTLNYAAWNSFPEVLDFPAAKVPEPATMLLVGAGLLGIAAFRKRSKK